MLLCSILCGRAWNGFLLGKSKDDDVPCRFCGGIDGDGHLFWDFPSPPFVRIRELPEFIPLMRLDHTAHGPAVLPGTVGYLPFLHEGYSLHGLSLR